MSWMVAVRWRGRGPKLCRLSGTEDMRFLCRTNTKILVHLAQILIYIASRSTYVLSPPHISASLLITTPGNLNTIMSSSGAIFQRLLVVIKQTAFAFEEYSQVCISDSS